MEIWNYGKKSFVSNLICACFKVCKVQNYFCLWGQFGEISAGILNKFFLGFLSYKNTRQNTNFSNSSEFMHLRINVWILIIHITFQSLQTSCNIDTERRAVEMILQVLNWNVLKKFWQLQNHYIRYSYIDTV